MKIDQFEEGLNEDNPYFNSNGNQSQVGECMMIVQPRRSRPR